MTRELEPKGESLQRAIRWISAERENAPSKPLRDIVNEAGPRFDLTPAESEYLWKTFVAARTE